MLRVSMVSDSKLHKHGIRGLWSITAIMQRHKAFPSSMWEPCRSMGNSPSRRLAQSIPDSPTRPPFGLSRLARPWAFCILVSLSAMPATRTVLGQRHHRPHTQSLGWLYHCFIRIVRRYLSCYGSLSRQNSAASPGAGTPDRNETVKGRSRIRARLGLASSFPSITILGAISGATVRTFCLFFFLHLASLATSTPSRIAGNPIALWELLESTQVPRQARPPASYNPR